MQAQEAARRFGKRVQALRAAEGISQEKLAERSGLHRTFIGRIERGETNVTLYNIIRIAKGLNVRARQLMDAVD